MFFRKGLLLTTIILLSYVIHAQTANNIRQPRILILLDGSSSMSYEWQNGEKRFDAAARIIISLIDSVYKVNKDVEFALRVYGHQSPAQNNNCYDTKLEVMFSKDNIEQMRLRLANLNPIGVSPIAFSLKEAAENDLPNPLRNVYSIVLITDGAESCGGDICNIAKELFEKKIDFKPYIIGLVDNPSLKSGYDCLGNYLPLTKENDIKPVTGKIVENYKQMFALPVLTVRQVTLAPPSVVKEAIVPKTEVKPVPTDTLNPNIEPLKRTRSNRTFSIYHSTLVPPLAKIPLYIKPSIQDEPIPQTKPAVTAPPKPKEPVTTTEPIRKEEPVQITKATIKSQTDSNSIAGEATLQVYISDGKSFFETTPMLVVLDKKTKKEITRFNRFVNINGSPRPQKLPAGSYLLSIADKEAKYGYIDFDLPAGKNTAITIPIQNGSILFSYKDNPKRQIKGYNVLVMRRFESRPVVEQKIEQELQYEPGTYNIRINTLPPWNMSFTLEMGTKRLEEIPEEGDLVIDNTKALGKVTLYYPYGDRFRSFYTAVLNGDGNPIKLKVLPGSYKAGYKQNPQLPLEEETMEEFKVTSNNVTNLELNK